MVAPRSAYASSPDYPVLDEPTAGLDGDGTRALAGLLSGLAGEGLTIVLSTHYPGFASAVGDAFAILDGGQVGSRSRTLDGVDSEAFGLRGVW